MSETLLETLPSTIIDLSVANSDIIETILLRLPGKEIIKCRKVCRKWNKITLSLSFWLSKEEYDGEKYIKSLINCGKPLFCENYAILSVKKPFERNILFDSNPNGKNEVKKHADPRWNFSSPGWVYSSPPSFLPDNFHPEFVDLFEGCLETTSSRCDKTCIINIKEIGLSPHLMDLYRPPIIFSEWISNQTDCRSIYWATIRLLNERHQVIAVKEKEQRFEFGELQKWIKVEAKIESYPSGIQYIFLSSVIVIDEFETNPCGARIAESEVIIKMEETSPSVNG